MSAQPRTYSRPELESLIAAETANLRRANRLGARECARSCRRTLRTLKNQLANLDRDYTIASLTTGRPVIIAQTEHHTLEW